MTQITQSAATRYLSAGAHLDSRFAEAVCDELVEPHRAVVPDPDLDLPTVVGHALAASRRQLLTDLALTAVLLVALLSATAKALAVVFGLCAAVATWRLIQDLRQRDTGAAVYHGLVAVFSWAVGLGPVLFRSVEGYFSGPQPYVRANLSGAQFVLALVMVLWAILVASRVSGQRGLARAGAGLAASSGRGWRGDRMAYLQRAAIGNVTVYSPTAPGGPFVGSGAVVTAWTMTIPLAPTPILGGHNEPLAGRAVLDVWALYDRLRVGLERLAEAPLTGRPLTGLTVEERLYVAGRLPIRHPLLERGRPLQSVPVGILRDVAAAGRGHERFYLGVRMVRPDAGATLSCFVYLSLAGGLLFVEFVQTAVPAVRGDFRVSVGTADVGGASVLIAVGAALLDVVKVAPLAPIETVRRVIGFARDGLRRSLTEKAEQSAGQFDFGARVGLRELAADGGHGVVDELDLNEYAQVIERCLLDSVAESLTEYGFDPSEVHAEANGPSRRTTMRLDRRASADLVRPI